MSNPRQSPASAALSGTFATAGAGLATKFMPTRTTERTNGNDGFEGSSSRETNNEGNSVGANVGLGLLGLAVVGFLAYFWPASEENREGERRN